MSYYIYIFLSVISLFIVVCYGNYYRASTFKNKKYFRKMSRYYFNRSDFVTVIDLCNWRLKKNNDDPEVLYIKAVSLYEKGSDKEAKAIFEKILIPSKYEVDKSTKYVEDINLRNV